MKNLRDKIENMKDGFSRLDSLVQSCCDDVGEYMFVPTSYSSSLYFGDKKVITIDERVISNVELLSKYDRKYLSALKMTVYHEVGHFKNPLEGQPRDVKEIAAELYAMDKCSLEDYITELAVISDTVKSLQNMA